MTSLAAIALAVLLALAGRRLAGPALAGGGAFRLVVAALAGMVALHLTATLLDLVGVRWGILSLGLPLFLLSLLLGRSRPEPAADRSGPGWGDGIAVFALLAFALLALSLWITAPDFVYHWGIKGHRFALARGLDYSWLGRPWNWVLHPDYPNLLPELYATTALIARRFGERGQMLWSSWFFLLILLAAREAFEQSRVERWTAQAGMALTAATLATFGIGHQMAGAADWMPALALAASLPALLRPADRAGDLQIGIAAAFAAASKVEGVALGALLVLIQLLRRPSPETVRSRFAIQRLLSLGLPIAAVVLPWLLQTFRHGLYQAFNSGSFDPGRARIVLPALADALATRGWHGLSAALLLIPLLFLSRRTRPVAWVAALQLGFYLWVYFTAAVDTRHQVVSSFPRLALHLVPALLAAGIVALEDNVLNRMNKTKTLSALSLMAAVLAFAPAAVAQDDPWALLQKVRQSLVEAGPTGAAFIQTYIPAGFTSGEKETGRISLALPDCLRWDYQDPYPKSFLLCGGVAHSWNPEDHTGRRYRINRKTEPGLDLLLLGVDDLKGRYQASSQALDGGRIQVSLTPKEKLAELADAALTVDAASRRVVAVSYHDREGNLTRFEIQGYRGLPRQGQFSPPSGIKWED